MKSMNNHMEIEISKIGERGQIVIPQEIRNKHLTREEGKALVKRFDGEFPDKYLNEVMDYLGIEPKHIIKHIDNFRSPHLWAKVNKEWKLRHTVNKDGVDD